MIISIIFLILFLAFIGIAGKVIGAVLKFILGFALKGAWMIFSVIFFFFLIMALI